MKKINNIYLALILGLLSVFNSCLNNNKESNIEQLTINKPGVQKIKDIVIYQDSLFFSAFPSVVKRPEGEIIVAFRRSPDHRIFGETYSNHVDPNSYLVMVSSTDGENWTKEPELIYAHPFGGSQDPCLLQLQDGTLLCASYGWDFLTPEGISNLKKPFFQNAGSFIFLGGYLLRSTDGGEKWQGPIYPPHVKAEINYNSLGIPLPAYNRGALYEGKDGRIFWAVVATDSTRHTTTHLLISNDKGLTWNYSCPIASDSVASFNETSVYETPKGDILAFLRTANIEDQACIARSTDGGKTFQQWESMGFQGHPLHALRLPDNRVLLTYGYRHKPFGIRARILNAECTDFSTSPEIILREDGGNADLGYTWSVQLDKNRVLVIYYFNNENSTRYIAGTILEIK
jgi:hypothetical protein